MIRQNWKQVVLVVLVLVIAPGAVIYKKRDVSKQNAERILRENAEADTKAKCLVPFDRAEAELDPVCVPFIEQEKNDKAKGGE